MKLRTLFVAAGLSGVLASQGCTTTSEEPATPTSGVCTSEICGDVLGLTTGAADTVGATFGEAAKVTIDHIAAERWAFSHVRLNPNALACLVLIATAMAESLPGDGKVATEAYDIDTLLRTLSEDSQIRVLSDNATTEQAVEKGYVDTHDAVKSPDALLVYAPKTAKDTQAFIEQVNVGNSITKFKAWALNAASAIAAKIPKVQLPKGPDLSAMKAQAMALLKQGLLAVAAWGKQQLPQTVQVGRDVPVPPVDEMVKLCAQDPRGCQCAVLECLPENPPPDVPQGLPYLYTNLDGYIQHGGPLTKIKLADYIDPFFKTRDLVVVVVTCWPGSYDESYLDLIYKSLDDRVQWVQVVAWTRDPVFGPASLTDLNAARSALSLLQSQTSRLHFMDVVLDPEFASLTAGGLPGKDGCPTTIVFNARTMKPLTTTEGIPLNGLTELQRNIQDWRTALRANL